MANRRWRDCLTVRNEFLAGGKTAQDMMNFFDTWAPHYENDMAILEDQSAVLTAGMIKEYCPKRNARILDVCGGTGMLGKQLCLLGYYHLDISDGSQEMLNQARESEVYKQFFLDVYDESSPINVNSNVYDVIALSRVTPFSKWLLQKLVSGPLKTGGLLTILQKIPEDDEEGPVGEGLNWLKDESSVGRLAILDWESKNVYKSGDLKGYCIVLQKLT